MSTHYFEEEMVPNPNGWSRSRRSGSYVYGCETSGRLASPSSVTVWCSSLAANLAGGGRQLILYSNSCRAWHLARRRTWCNIIHIKITCVAANQTYQLNRQILPIIITPDRNSDVWRTISCIQHIKTSAKNDVEIKYKITSDCKLFFVTNFF